MSENKTSICSMAAVSLGAKPISNLLEATDRALLANALYEQVRDNMLRAHPWNCARKRVLLAPLTTSPPFDWAYQFQMPPDCLKVLQVGEYGAELDYRIEGQLLLCDQPSAPLLYIYRNDNESTWDAMFVTAMVQAMATAMCYGITKSAAKEQLEMQKLQQQLRAARAVNSQDIPPEQFGDFPLMSARLGGRSA